MRTLDSNDLRGKIVGFINNLFAFPFEKRVRLDCSARIPGRNFSSILRSLLNTVGANPTGWHYDPFSVELAEDRIYGLGTTDMKSGGNGDYPDHTGDRTAGGYPGAGCRSHTALWIKNTPAEVQK